MHLIASRLGSAVGLAAALTAAQAQPAPAASSPTPSERARRDADKVFQMILQHADKPRRVPADAGPRTPATVRSPRSVAAPAANTAPTPAAEPRVTATTAPEVASEPTELALTNADVAPTASASVSATATPDAAAPEIAAAAAAPVAAMVSVAVATPRSLKLELASSIEPEFPARLVRQLGKGSVVVNFDVRPDGTVSRTEIVSSSHRGLNEPARAAVAAWRFKPISETLPGVVELKFE